MSGEWHSEPPGESLSWSVPDLHIVGNTLRINIRRNFDMMPMHAPRISRSVECDIIESILSNASIASSYNPALCRAACLLS